jgi:hypothetical protein
MFIGKSQAAIPRTIWTLGYVSLFMDLSSELVHSILPVFLTGTIGAGLWGLHMGFTVGILAALVAGTTPPESKGSAFFAALVVVLTAFGKK